MQAATKYTDLGNGRRETVFFFMLNAYLNSRIDTNNESNGDEEVNMYMAALLESLVDGSFYVDHADSLAPTPTDVFSKIEDSHSDRRKFDVYRTNADHRLVAFGLFAGWGHEARIPTGAQERARPLEPLLHRIPRGAQQQRRLGGAQPLEVVQHDRVAVDGR